ncbi:PDZK1-interacting protein 1 isoform X2 [Eschrichtius robustus]|uniref:PDZK1-interacting protein 1 isoform X2 n=1 Tax=Eschrichtius robustus TaxID=9764 RepID=UPI0035BEF754
MQDSRRPEAWSTCPPGSDGDKADLSRHRQAPRQLQEPRFQRPERRPRSRLQPCLPSAWSSWACSRQCHPPAVNKGACEHGPDRWKQSRWDPGRNGWQVLLDGGQFQVQ